MGKKRRAKSGTNSKKQRLEEEEHPLAGVPLENLLRSLCFESMLFLSRTSRFWHARLSAEWLHFAEQRTRTNDYFSSARSKPMLYAYLSDGGLSRCSRCNFRSPLPIPITVYIQVKSEIRCVNCYGQLVPALQHAVFDKCNKLHAYPAWWAELPGPLCETEERLRWLQFYCTDCGRLMRHHEYFKELCRGCQRWPTMCICSLCLFCRRPIYACACSFSESSSSSSSVY
jgi:hypothetical protein